tara:strand:+ start:42752 stop:43093 length:342 start_codon:yes stop_codon:yes gene_type:complete
MKYLIPTILVLCLAGCQKATDISYDNPHFDATRAGDQAVVLQEVRGDFHKEYPQVYSINYTFEETKDGVFVIYQWDEQETHTTTTDGKDVVQIKAGKWKRFVSNERLKELIDW